MNLSSDGQDPARLLADQVCLETAIIADGGWIIDGSEDRLVLRYFEGDEGQLRLVGLVEEAVGVRRDELDVEVWLASVGVAIRLTSGCPDQL